MKAVVLDHDTLVATQRSGTLKSIKKFHFAAYDVVPRCTVF